MPYLFISNKTNNEQLLTFIKYQSISQINLQPNKYPKNVQKIKIIIFKQIIKPTKTIIR